MDVSGNSDEISEGSKEWCSIESVCHLRECILYIIYCHEQNISRNVDVKISFAEISEGNEEHY